MYQNVKSHFYHIYDGIQANPYASGIIFFGISLRIAFWQILYPVWKHFSVFLVFELPILQYLGNFEGYKPTRSPFYDLFSAITYAISEPVVGIRGLTLFSLIISCLAVPAIFIVTRRLFNQEVAVFTTMFYALYPKFLFLTGQGLPEAASASIIVLSLYILTDHSGSLRGSLSAGLSVTVAYLVYIPAVLYAVYTWFALVASEIDLSSKKVEYIGSPVSVLAYTIIPGIVGVVYLIFGPVKYTFESAGGGTGTGVESLFITPESYTIVEKILYYVSYYYFDFWWFTRGFDKERNVLSTIQPLIENRPIFLICWTGTTLILTIIILNGIMKLTTRQNRIDNYIVGWLVVYILIDIYNSIGWAGAFQFRHIFPVFPAIALIFGIGAKQISEFLYQNTKLYDILYNAHSLLGLDMKKTFQVFVLLLLIFMIPAATVGGLNSATQTQVSEVDPVIKLTNEVSTDSKVVVTSSQAYRLTYMFSEGKVKPTVLISEKTASERLSNNLTKLVPRTVSANATTVSSQNISRIDADYLFVLPRCGYTVREQKLIQNSLTGGGSIVYEITNTRGSRCDTKSILIKI